MVRVSRGFRPGKEPLRQNLIISPGFLHSSERGVGELLTWIHRLGVRDTVVSPVSSSRRIAFFEITHADERAKLRLMERDSPPVAFEFDPGTGKRSRTVLSHFLANVQYVEEVLIGRCGIHGCASWKE